MMFAASVSQHFAEIQPNLDNLDQNLQKSKIPFMFSSSPMRLVDEKIIAQLDGNTCKVLLVLQRFLDLTNQIRVGKRALLSGWTLCISHRRISELTHLSRRTVIRKIKVLADAGIITLKKWGPACKYLFMEFHNEIQKLEDEYAQEQAFEEELANLTDDNDEPDAPDCDAPDSDNGGKPVDDSQPDTPNSNSDAPNDDASDGDAQGDQTADQSTQPPDAHEQSARNDTFVNRNRVVLAAPVSTLTLTLPQLAHIKETFVKEVQTLSSKVSKLFRIAENNQNPKNEREKHQQEENDWQQHAEYAQLFYGDISSKKFHKDVCLYFKHKALEFGVSEDGQDRLILAIPKIKSYGAKTHIAFDYEFGVRAYNEVLDEEELRLNQPDDMESEEQQQRNKHNAHKMDYDIKTLFKHASPVARRMAAAIESRHTAATAMGYKGYSDAEIEQMWVRAYAEYGEPQSHDQWTDDRFGCHQLLVAKGVRIPLDNEETQVIIDQANKLFPS